MGPLCSFTYVYRCAECLRFWQRASSSQRHCKRIFANTYIHKHQHTTRHIHIIGVNMRLACLLMGTCSVTDRQPGSRRARAFTVYTTFSRTQSSTQQQGRVCLPREVTSWMGPLCSFTYVYRCAQCLRFWQLARSPPHTLLFPRPGKRTFANTYIHKHLHTQTDTYTSWA